MHGQLLLLGVEGTTLTNDEKKLFSEIQPGGYILFSRNIEAPQQVRELTDSLRELSTLDPLICIDQEGGRVTRTKAIGHSAPSAQELRDAKDSGLIARHGMITADVLRLLGINMNLCPVLDISYDDESDNALRGRCYGADSQEVIVNAGIFNSNHRYKRKMLTCGKHFPGGSLADIDPHYGLPTTDKTIEEMMDSDLLPYHALIPTLDGILSSHVHFSSIDSDTPGLPASLSRRIITDLLRYRLDYKGIIMTDDLDMGAIVNTYGRGTDVQMAIQAGNDMAMVCHAFDTFTTAHQALLDLPYHDVCESMLRVEKLKKRLPKLVAYDQQLWDKYDEEIRQLCIDTLGTDEDTTPEKSNSPVEDY